jgi:hypothetical protein
LTVTVSTAFSQRAVTPPVSASSGSLNLRTNERGDARPPAGCTCSPPPPRPASASRRRRQPRSLRHPPPFPSRRSHYKSFLLA